MLKAAMMESATLELNEKQMSEIVDQTFSMVAQHPDRITMGMNTFISFIFGVIVDVLFILSNRIPFRGVLQYGPWKSLFAELV